MAVFKCKMCGGALEIGENQSVATCEYCGTQQTLPKLDNEKKLALFSRANNLRIKSEFDKAAGIYESIIAEFRDEAEAYWGLVLCKYGIEYVDDGKGKRIPTCHRTLPISVMEDDDFQQACEYAEITAKNIYREEAKAIDKIQKKILDIAVNEDPYDIFICYKETDDVTGSRTEDSSIAQDIYTHLLKDGYRVFYSRVSLREVAGTEYEPYIYAALSSAKIMLAIGTKHEYYDAVWVKNEWSRFISMMGDDSGKVLIPCFRDMDAYDMPKEFKNMQALDMGDVTFFGSLMENIERIVDKTRVKAVKETIVLNNDTGDIAPLLERGFLFLEDKDWQKADEFFEAVLNKDPKNGNAYLGKLLADLEISKFENLSDFYTSFSGNNNYEKIMRFGNSELKESIKKANDIIVHRNEEARKKDIYDKALQMMVSATTEAMFENAGYMFQEIKDYLDAKEKSDECFEKGEEARIRAEEEEFTKIYDSACYVVTSEHTWSNKLNDLSQAVVQLEKLNGWRDSEEKAVQGRAKIEEIKAKLEEERIESERMLEFARQVKAKRNRRYKKIAIVVSAVTLAGIIFFSVLTTAIIPNRKYNDAIELLDSGEYIDALTLFRSLNGFKDSEEYVSEIMGELAGKETFSAGAYHAVGLKSDGTVVATGKNYGGECDISDWTDIVAISAGYWHTVGLKPDGTVVATGYNHNGQCDVDYWTDIVAISAGKNHTVGLKSDGTVVATEYSGDYYKMQCDVYDWTDIIAISTGDSFTVGLKADGTVIAIGDSIAVSSTEDWTDIIAVSAGDKHVVGLKSDGTVVATGDNSSGECNVSEWTDIVAVSANKHITFGLKSDGTVVAVGYNYYGQCDTEDWTDIVAVTASDFQTFGLKADGTVVVAGNSDYEGNLYDASDWTDIKLPNE